MKLSIPVVLSFIGGYVDTAGFLALQGLFTAHVTGNFVTLAAALLSGSSGIVAKLLALPVFCIVIVVTRLMSHGLRRLNLPVLRTMLTLQLALLAMGAAMALSLRAQDHGDALPVVLTGMVLVAAMAIQNAASRIHIASAPPTTLMTGTTTQMMVDLADLLHGGGPEPERSAMKARLLKMGANVAGFALGCAAGALLFSQFKMGCFVLPPLLVALPILMNASRDQP